MQGCWSVWWGCWLEVEYQNFSTQGDLNAGRFHPVAVPPYGGDPCIDKNRLCNETLYIYRLQQVPTILRTPPARPT